jgi:hypothetical protein
VFLLYGLGGSARGYLFFLAKTPRTQRRIIFKNIQRKRRQRCKRTQVKEIYRLGCSAGTIADLPAVPSGKVSSLNHSAYKSREKS